MMGKHSLKLLGLLSLALTFAVVAPPRAAADDDDPPSRVARLGYTYGSISFEPAGTEDWVSAIVNRPMTTGDKLWADNDSRAELHIGSASLRISSNTGFSFLNLTDKTAQVSLTQGTLRVRIKHLDDDETFEIDTPNLAFSILRPGIYRINVNEGGDTTIISVPRGQGEVTGGGSAYTVHPREVGTFSGTDSLSSDIEPFQGDNDPFESWCSDRDRHEDTSVSARYVSPDVIGYQDLDANGDWRPAPGYGTIWFPRVAVGWAPYHYGHWAYVAPWGYTWVDDAPWGFAPFHYGRWVAVGGVWGWVPAPPPTPGVVYVRPVYAPALVAWVGGPHFGVGVAVGGGGGFAAGVSVGWFPLGPREVYVPSYPVSRTYVNNVNVSNTTVNTTVVNNYYNTTVVNNNTTVNNTNINNTNIHNTNVVVNNQKYVNQSVPGAVTATTPQAFTSAQSVSKNAVAVNPREVASAPVSASTPAVAPAKQAVLGTSTQAAVKPPATMQSRAVVAKAPPPPPPPSFAKQQQAIQANGGRPLAAAQVRQIQPQAATAPRPTIKMAPPTPGTPQNAQGNRNGQPANGGNGVSQPQNAGGNRTGAVNNPGQPARNPQPNNGAPSGQPSNAGNRPGMNNQNQPAQQQNNTANRPTNAGNPSQPMRNDRPPSSPSNGGNTSGQPSNAGNRQGANNQNQPAQQQNNTANRPTNASNPSQPTQNNRPPSSQPSNSEQSRPQRSFDDRPQQQHSQPAPEPRPAENVDRGRQNQPPKPQKEEKQKPSKEEHSKDEHSHDKKD
ncbi:MAG TPA: DUF6600 domain-containing protein [Candidatus Angelobacter sp.]|nr:DUF6600 domain-containing protein [Candidatus Angelobacter sp.]